MIKGLLGTPGWTPAGLCVPSASGSWIPIKTEEDKPVPDINLQLTPFVFFQAWELEL